MSEVILDWVSKRILLITMMSALAGQIGLGQIKETPPTPLPTPLLPLGQPKSSPPLLFDKPIVGQLDHGLPLPDIYGTPGSQDAAALQEILDHLSSVGALFTVALEATGTTTDASGTNSSPSTLWLAPGGMVRLDYGAPGQLRSIRYSSTYGAQQRGTKPVRTEALPAATVGFLPIMRLRDTAFPGGSTGVYDRGLVTVDGSPLHRITLGLPLGTPSQGGDPARDYTYIDYYFDPTTHLLIKTATRSLGDMHSFIRQPSVITYGDYRTFAGMKLPFSLTETFAGQVLWTLKLDAYQIDPAFSTSTFHF